ncbi:metal-sensing transcriptional repressor [Bdellovibrio sp. GT3]|uniref:metal-sensing transcriptional repressor n=1 Tax=Bdellovibrio sp. GT3 TaxID=3136282 RepID=UPI0030F0C799
MAEHTHTRAEEVQMHLRAAEQGLQAIQNMIEKGQSCVSIVQQLTGIMNRLADCRAMVARDHIASCIRTAVIGKFSREVS